MTELRGIDTLHVHPENAQLFSENDECEQYGNILASIRKFGIWEPLAIKEDGTILSGHIRHMCARQLKLKQVPVRVVEAFQSYRDEVEFIIRCNTDRRQLSKGEIALAFNRLKNLPSDKGGAKRKMGRPAKRDEKSGINPQLSRTRSRDDAAAFLGISADEGRALETVFTTPGVPAELKAAVNRGDVAVNPAAKAVRTEVKRQGGEIKDASVLQAVAKPVRPAPPSQAEQTHEQRMQEAAAAYERDYRELFDVYKKLSGIIYRRPLKSVLGPTEHHQYGGMLRDISIAAWREVESVTGPTEHGKQLGLTVLTGGKK